jgi:signal transduction histidine kinase
MFLWLRVQKLMFKGKECKMLTIRDLTKLLSVEKIESENRFFNTLTATVTHEMMTPLNCIITFGRSLLNTEYHSKAKIIVNVAQLIKMNLKDLLDRSLIENGKLVPNFEKHNLHQLISQVVEMMQSQADMKEVRINFDGMDIESDFYMLDVQRSM